MSVANRMRKIPHQQEARSYAVPEIWDRLKWHASWRGA